MVEIIPDVFENDWVGFSKKIAEIAHDSSWVHVDVSDGTMEKQSTVTDFTQLSQISSGLKFEAHLLVSNPEKYIKPLADAGFSRLVAHVESNDPRRFLATAKFEEVEVGLAIDGTTEIVEIEPFLEEIDFVMVLSAEATSQKFLPEALEKVKLLRQNYPDLIIAVEGGITDANMASVEEAGATRIIR